MTNITLPGSPFPAGAYELTMMLVDDDEATLHGLSRLLSRFFNRVDTYSNPHEALDSYKSHGPYDIVIADILMPGMNGLDLIDKMKGVNEEQRAVILTAHSEADYLFRAIELSLDGFIIKPVRREQLYALLNKIIRGLLAEREIRDREERYHQLVNNIRSGVAIYRVINDGENFEFIDVNRAAEEMLNITQEAVSGELVTDLFPVVIECGLLDVFREVFRSGESRTAPSFYYTDNDVRLWMQNFIYRLPSGEVVTIFDGTPEPPDEA